MSSWKLSDLLRCSWPSREAQDRRNTCPIQFMMITLPPRCRTPRERVGQSSSRKFIFMHLHTIKSQMLTLMLSFKDLSGLFTAIFPPRTARHLCLWVLSGFFLKARRIARIPKGFSPLFSHCHRQTDSLSFCELVFVVVGFVSSHLWLLWLEYGTHKKHVISATGCHQHKCCCFGDRLEKSPEEMLEGLQESDSGGIGERTPNSFKLFASSWVRDCRLVACILHLAFCKCLTLFFSVFTLLIKINKTEFQ